MTGCSVGPSYVKPCIETPPAWKNPNDEKCIRTDFVEEGELTYLDFWWEVFEDDKLDELEALALQNNRDLFIAYERIQEYRALMGIAAADFYPQVNLNPQYTNTGELITNYVSKNSIIPVTPNGFRAHEFFYFLPLNLSYEVDLWGKIRDQYNYAKYNWLAQEKDYEALMLSLTSSLATAYYQLRAADTQIDLLEKIIKTREKSFQINKDRYDDNIILYSDVAEAAEEVDSVKLQHNEILRQRGVLEDQIAVLIGIPSSEFHLDSIPLRGLPPCIPEGIPSEILMRRPDIAEAEYQTRAAHAMVKQAYTQFYPSLILTGAVGYESPVLKEFLKWVSRYWMEGAQINQVVFDGFRTPNNLRLQVARFYEAGGEYQKIVLQAFQEVEDALNNLEFYSKEYDNSLGTTYWAQKSFQLFTDRYQLGVINYIDVVNTERDLLNFQTTLNSIQGYRFVATIQLIKALGGGWSYPSQSNIMD